MSDININFLRIPLNLIEHVNDVDAFQGLSAQQLAALPRDYTPDEIAAIVAALRFASDHPEFDFVSMLPGVSQPNAKIHGFLIKILNSLEATDICSTKAS